jgi:hypothetical protein
MSYQSPVTLFTNTQTIGVGTRVYIDGATTPLATWTYVFIDGGLWDYNPTTGQITAYSQYQP